MRQEHVSSYVTLFLTVIDDFAAKCTLNSVILNFNVTTEYR